jgi:hypothetical protein
MSDETAEPNVLGFVDDAHSAAQFLDDAAVGDGLADHWKSCIS